MTPESPKPVPHLKSPDEFFPNPQVSTVIEDMRKQMERELIENPVDEDAIRAAQDWEYLQNQAVGAEVPESEMGDL